MKEKPNYYAVLTSEVRYDNRLSDSEKLLYAEITSLSHKTGECWASNDYFANLYDVSISTIQRRISKLKKLGYIDVKFQYKKGSKEIEKRIVKIATTYGQNCYGGHSKSAMGGHSKNDLDNNTSIEYYKNNNISPIVPLEKWFEEFWSCYPKKVGKSVAKKSYEKKVTSEQIHNQILKDLEKRKHYEQWKKNNGQFILNPSTYLNQERWKDEYEISMTGSTQLDEWGQLYQKYKESET